MTQRLCCGLFAALMVTLTAVDSNAQLLLRQDFDGSGIVDPTVWRLPFGTEGTFVGRTQYRGDTATDMPLQGVAEASANDGFVTEIHLDTYSPIDPGNQFLGTDLLTKGNFARGGGLSFEARMRLKPTTAGGLVNGFFLFDVTRDDPPGGNNLVRDEIDFELISNQAVGSATNDPYTNYWNDGPFTGAGAAGDGQFVDVPGVDLTQFQDYRVDWTPQSIKWYVNDNLVRTETSNVPDDPMKLHLNLWAPDSDFADAFNAALQPTADENSNVRYTAQIDHVEVNRFDTTASANLLTDGSFEIAQAPTPIQNVPATTTDEWLSFGNVFYEPDEGVPPGTGTDPTVPDMAIDGIFAAKMFGPFKGQPDASGILQNVVATPGEEFEASVWAQTPVGDTIDGSENFNTVAISFLDASGNVIQEAFADPGNLVDSNGKDFPLLDGRDPNLVEDEWVQGTVSAIAPAGTAFARMSLFFIQLNNEGGASWFDDAQLIRLTADTPIGLLGDADGDGDVDGDDLIAVQTSFGSTSPPSPLFGDADFDGDVDGDDLIAVQTNFGNTAATSIPEPATIGCLVLGLLAAPLRRRRG